MNLRNSPPYTQPHGQALDPMARFVRFRQIDFLAGRSLRARRLAWTGYVVCLL